MLTTILVAALGMGFLGSVHCAAMCGPLALAGSCRRGALSRRDTVGYFGGRLASYALLGAVMGHFGAQAASFLPLERVQLVAVIMVAAAALVRGLSLIVPRLRPRRAGRLVGLPRPSQRSFASSMLKTLGELFPRRGLGLGLATGILPCGLLASAWVLAASTARAPDGALVMAAFSAATLPGLALPLAAERLLAKKAKLSMSPAWVGAAWCLLAVLVSVRAILSAHGQAACH